MNTSILKLFIVNSPKTKFSDAQVLLQEFTGTQFSRNDADNIWANVSNHKWNMSEQLGRDVGFKVAAIDFIENFYQKGDKKVNSGEQQSGIELKIPLSLKCVIRLYFEAKENITH